MRWNLMENCKFGMKIGEIRMKCCKIEKSFVKILSNKLMEKTLASEGTICSEITKSLIKKQTLIAPQVHLSKQLLIIFCLPPTCARYRHTNSSSYAF